MWNIGNVEIKNRVVLAPMAGISDPSFMRIVESLGCGYAVTELISAEAVVRENKKTFDMLNGIDKIKMPVAIQLFGGNPEVLSEAAKIIEEKFHPSIIDINMGCPVPKVAVRSLSGASLLKDPVMVGKIVRAVVDAVNVPVTVKIRSGWDSNSINAVEIAKIIESSGASAIAIHGRTRSQGYSGKSDWNIIKKVKENVSIPVIGNGDITTCYLAKQMLDDTKCDAVMIGRGLLGNPWLIKETVDYLENGTIPKQVTPEEKINMLKTHFSYLVQDKSEKAALLEIRSHALWYVKGLNGASKIKNEICTLKSAEEMFKLLDDYLNH